MLSIVIPSYNEGNAILETIENLIDNICGSNYITDYEIIVVDSSTDNTFEILQHSRLNKKNRINLIKNSSRIFPGEARNLGVKKSKYDIIVFTDSGFTFSKNWLDKLIKPLITNNSIDISWGVTETSVVNSKDRMFAYLIESKQIQRRVIPNVAIRKKVFEDGHWFESDLRAVEDTRFINEVKDKYNEVFVEAVNYYSGHPQSLSDAFKKWSTYSYYSYIAGYKRKAALSILQASIYIIVILLFRNKFALLLVLLLQLIRVILKSNNKYKVRILEFLYIMILSFYIDFGRLHGSLKGILNMGKSN